MFLDETDKPAVIARALWRVLGRQAMHAAVGVTGRRRFREDGHDLVASTLGEGPQVPFLALARLIVGRDTAVEGHLSQLNPSRFRL
jgi:hypothetical protein